MSLPHGSETALDPLNQSLAGAAHARATAMDSTARVAANQVRAAAEHKRKEIVGDAEAAGRHDAEAATALISARARRGASELILATQEQIRTDLRDRILRDALALVNDPRYPRMLKHLTLRAQKLLGADAVVTVSSNGGVTAVALSRRVDLTLPTLAEAKFDELTEELSPLWQR